MSESELVSEIEQLRSEIKQLNETIKNHRCNHSDESSGWGILG